MTRKNVSTDPDSRWRDAPVVPMETGARCAVPAPGPLVPPRSANRRQRPNAAARRTADSAFIAINEGEEDSLPPGVLSRLGTVRNSSWLASAAIHLLLLILLALLTYHRGSAQNGIQIKAEWSEQSPGVEFQMVQSQPTPGNQDGQSDPQPVEIEVVKANDAATSAAQVSPLQATPLDPVASTQFQTGGAEQTQHQHAYLGGGGMSARTPEGRRVQGERFGATPQSEQAVENALRWLAAHQRDDGSWSFDLQLAPCEGRCRNGRKENDDTPTPSTAATGLALLAFLGAGYTSETGPYQEVVQRGLYYLRSAAAETQFGYDWQQAGSMYGHGIALLAMSEALGMTAHEDRFDTDLWHYANQGTRFTVSAQHESGSWGYTPGSPGDTTLTGWQILSLIGAKKAGVQTRSDTFSRAKKFLMSVREEPEFQFGYRSPEAEPTTTAIALTLLMYLGQTPGYSPFDRAIDKMAERGPTLTNVYHDYYATMALHHFRHRDWEQWNQKLRDHLIAQQATEGHEAGSWHFRDKWGDVGGRVYTTAMCALTLEVYYRYLPLYEAPPEFPL